MKHMLCRAALTMAVLSALGTTPVWAIDADTTVQKLRML